jgi:hypothetical protein
MEMVATNNGNEEDEEDPFRKSSMSEELRLSQRQQLCCGFSMAKNDKRLIQMVFLFAAVILFGGLCFYALEEPAELYRLQKDEETVRNATHRILALLGNNQTLFDLLHNSNALDAFREPDNEDHWTFTSASLFAFTVVTTIGYGTFAPTTDGGRLFLVVYAIFGVPTAGITLVFVADRALHCVTICFHMGLGHDKLNKAYNAFDIDGSGALDLSEFRDAVTSLGMDMTDAQFEELVTEVDADGSGTIDREEFAVAVTKLNADVTEAAGRSDRIKVVLIALFVWMGIGMAVFIAIEKWTFAEGIYFSFVTLTTIGLGDLFPKEWGGHVFLIFYAMIGLGELAVLLTLIEGLLSDWDKAGKIALAKARQAAVLAREKALAARRSSMTSGSRNGESLSRIPSWKRAQRMMRIGIMMRKGKDSNKQEMQSDGDNTEETVNPLDTAATDKAAESKLNAPSAATETTAGT